MNIKSWLKYAVSLLSHLNTPLLDAEVLLSYVLRKPRAWIMVFNDFLLSNTQLNLLYKLIHRRVKHEPIAYITKEKEFWSLSFQISKGVLIPRPDTEILVEKILERMSTNDYILDLGCGCGNIALSVAYERLDCFVFGIDCLQEAIVLSKKNSVILNINNAKFFYSNWFSEVQQKFNIIISNPPYISSKSIFYLDKEILFEPKISLISPDNGLSDIKLIIKYSKNYLFSRGWLLIEHGWNQKNQVIELFKKYNFSDITSYQDYHGQDRIVCGRNHF
ncbi:peptide chain release factor N(5)-glutamine methyltransferase [Buchnera aphidicola]|uniref:peptide chain release factor N(5)-glutamine methyltransferase n=1 Tax=Buchnera aphidicola TaxID=9 RepID=UPI00346444D8